MSSQFQLVPVYRAEPNSPSFEFTVFDVQLTSDDIAADELFDISPYAEATVAYFMRHPASQNLPRKFKISFSGSPADRGLNLMHDVGAMAAVKDGVRGFKEPGLLLAQRSRERRAWRPFTKIQSLPVLK